MARGENTAHHPARVVHRERFSTPSKEVELYTDPHTWDEDRLDEWAASEPVTKAAAWLRDHNGPF
jgi:hypothetical protein